MSKVETCWKLPTLFLCLGNARSFVLKIFRQIDLSSLFATHAQIVEHISSKPTPYIVVINSCTVQISCLRGGSNPHRTVTIDLTKWFQGNVVEKILSPPCPFDSPTFTASSPPGGDKIFSNRRDLGRIPCLIHLHRSYQVVPGKCS